MESYVFRRAVCSIPTNSMNKTFANFSRGLKKEHYLESIQAQFLLLPSYRRFPSDDEFKRDIWSRTSTVSAVAAIGSADWRTTAARNGCPSTNTPLSTFSRRTKTFPNNGRPTLAPEWERIQETYLHTLGNLTLTAYNPEYSDRPFQDKRDMPDKPEQALKVSPLKLNQGLGQLDPWNEETIKCRADKLAGMALNVWPAPKLDPAVLDTYRPKPTPAAGYTIDDHPHLVSGLVVELFKAFNKEVLALDPCVTGEFLKLYVAYKAETNFVDVIPQKKQLRLSLNMKFPEINDPRGICKDVAGLGRWGNGDVEVSLSTFEELPYVMGLVRQSLEKQLGNGGDA